MKFIAITISAILGLAVTVQAQNVNLRVAQQKTVAGTGLKIKFLSVIEDSRCPENARCIWAGVARVSFEVRKNGKPAKTFELNTNELDKSATYEGYRINLTSLTPYPKDNTPINRSTYSAAVTFAKIAR